MKNKNIVPILILLVIILWILTPIITYEFTKNNGTNIGMVGDQFGSINALFSGLAFVGVIWAITLQRNELKLQRESIDLQRKELQQNTAELKNQAKALQGQLQVAQFTAQLNAIPALMKTEDEYLCRIRGGNNGTFLSYTDKMLENSIEKIKKEIISYREAISKKETTVYNGIRPRRYENLKDLQTNCESLEDQISKMEKLNMFRKLRTSLFQKISDITI